MKAVILAGGLGTRLRPVFPTLPKALAPAAGKPFLAYQIENLAAQGFNDLVLCVGYQAAMIVDYLKDGESFGVRIQYAYEETLLGTGGALKNAQALLDAHPFLLLNGDTYLELDLMAFCQTHLTQRRNDPHCIGTLAAVAAPDASAAGALSLDALGRIISFQEKMIQQSGWINGGVYCLSPEVLDWLPLGQKVSLECETFPAVMQSGRSLYAYPTEGFFVDIGTPVGYQRFVNFVGGKG